MAATSPGSGSRPRASHLDELDVLAVARDQGVGDAPVDGGENGTVPRREIDKMKVRHLSESDESCHVDEGLRQGRVVGQELVPLDPAQLREPLTSPAGGNGKTRHLRT